MNQDQGYIMTCPKCGNEMNSNARYCMKCGYINTEHEANQSMKKYVKNVETTYQVGSGGIITNDTSGESISLATNTGNKRLAFFITYGIYLGLVLFVLYTVITNGVNSINTLAISYFPIMASVLSITFLYIYSLELIFMKCNRKWWEGLIPIYNLIVLCDIVFHKKYIGLLIFIPVIGQIFLLVTIYKLGVKFKYNGLLTVLFPIIFLPLMAYSEHTYEGKTYIDGDKSLEKDYKLKKIFLTTTIILFIIGLGLFILSNIGSIKKTKQLFGNSYYIYAANKMVKKVKRASENNMINCKNGTYNEHNGVYYVYYKDVGDYMYLPLYMSREAIEAYVKIDNDINQINSEYFVSMSDGKFGFPEVNSKDIKLDKVVEYPNLGYNENNITCEIID